MNPNTDDLKHMLDKAERKLQVAELLLNKEMWDDASSRAYYAAFHAISAVLWSKNLSYSSHGQTIGAFNKEFIHTKVFPKDFTKILNRLFEDRQVGDYGFAIMINEKEAKQDVKDARTIVKSCCEYLLNSDK